MKKVLSSLACLALLGAAPQEAETPTVASMPPVVVQTVPAAGSLDVDPDLNEICVTFSKDMKDQTWTWSTAWKDSTPKFLSPPRYDKDKRTCIAKVKLEAGRSYGFWLNSSNFGNFMDKDGHPAVPYLLVFETKPDKHAKKK